MKKKVLLIIISVLAVAVMTGILAGCTETYKTKPLATDYSEYVKSNGGMAVVYGDYLYFINGNAGNTDIDNVYGKPIKGAIARVALENGKPTGKAQIVVPKAVYGTDKEYGGLYIVNDYIYYSTPNSERSGSGAQKLTEMVIMRTKVDGTNTQQIAKFDDFSVVFAVENNNLMYVRKDELHSINLANKKFPDTKVEDTTILTNYKMVEGYIIYCMYNNNDSTDYVMKAYSWAGGDPIVLADSATLRKDGSNTKYTMSLIDANSDDKTFTAYFTLKDDGLNSPEEGICSFTFDKANLVFKKENMIRYTNNASTVENMGFTQFERAGDYIIAMTDTLLYVYKKDGTHLKTNIYKGEELVPIKVTFAGTQISQGIKVDGKEVNYIYEYSSAFYSLQLFEIAEDGSYDYVEKNAEKIFGGSVDASYCPAEIIDGVVYFMNSNVANNAYYFVIPDAIDANTSYDKVELLGEVTRADFITAISAA